MLLFAELFCVTDLYLYFFCICFCKINCTVFDSVIENYKLL